MIRILLMAVLLMLLPCPQSGSQDNKGSADTGNAKHAILEKLSDLVHKKEMVDVTDTLIARKQKQIDSLKTVPPANSDR